MEKHTRLISPYPTDQWGLSLSENGSASPCKTVLMYHQPCQLVTMVILNMHVITRTKKVYSSHLIALKKACKDPKTNCHESDLVRGASVYAQTSNLSLCSMRDTISLHVSLKLLSRGQSLCASLFVALPCCHRAWPYGSQKDRGCVLW